MLKGEKVLAIITARGGSKRLPLKNVLSLGGKPLIAWTIKAAKMVRYIDTVMVSTDDLEIAQIALDYEAEVPYMRPEELANDTASSIDVVYNVINFYNQNVKKYKYIALLQPTSPLRSVKDIEAAMEMLTESTKAVVSVCETEHSPLWSNTLPKNLSMSEFIKDEVKDKRSQDLPKYYRLNGAIYIADINYLLVNKGFFGKYTKAYIMPSERSIDIDTEIDLQLCSVLINKSYNE